MYTKNDFGRELAEEINKNFDIEKLSRWAHIKYLDHDLLDEEADRVIMILIAMIEGEEFVRTKEELLKMANDLQKS